MGLNLKNQKSSSGPQQELLEVGTYPARLVRVIDLGLQAQQPYQGMEKPPVNKVDLTYELLDVFMVDKEGKEDESKPRWVSESIALHHPSADLAKSTKRAKAIDPEGQADFDLSQMLGMPCMVTIVHKESKGKTYANIGNVSVMRPREAQKAPKLKNTPTFFSLEEPDMEVFKGLPGFIQDLIKGNLEFKGSALDKALGGGGNKEPAKEVGDDDNSEDAW